MDALIKKKHRQIKAMRDKIFNTPYARNVDIYRPYKDEEGKHVLEDELEFEEADEIGTLKADENLPISYDDPSNPEDVKAVRCKVDPESGKISHVRSGEANEFEEDKQYNFLIKSDDVPSRTVMQLEASKTLEAASKYDNWSDTTIYSKGGKAKEGEYIYSSLKSNNLNHSLTDTEWWEQVSHQLVTLIKVSTIPIGKQPFIDFVHVFVSFHGEM